MLFCDGRSVGTHSLLRSFEPAITGPPNHELTRSAARGPTFLKWLKAQGAWRSKCDNTPEDEK